MPWRQQMSFYQMARTILWSNGDGELKYFPAVSQDTPPSWCSSCCLNATDACYLQKHRKDVSSAIWCIQIRGKLEPWLCVNTGCTESICHRLRHRFFPAMFFINLKKKGGKKVWETVSAIFQEVTTFVLPRRSVFKPAWQRRCLDFPRATAQ